VAAAWDGRTARRAPHAAHSFGALAMPSVPTVSVAVAVRRRPDGLNATLASVFDQALPAPVAALDVLVILAPDEPEPRLAATGEGADFRLVRAGGPGVGAARAAALAASRGEFLAVCDAGDRWADGCLDALLPPLLDEPSAVLVYAVPSDVPAGFTPAGWTSDPRSELRETPPCAVVLRADAARAAGGYASPLQAGADNDLWLRIMSLGALRRVAATVASAARPTPAEAEALAADLARLERLDAWRQEVVKIARRYVARRAGAPIEPFDPATWDASPGGRRELIWHSQLRRTKSFGLVGRRLLLAVARQGITTLVTPLAGEAPADLVQLGVEPARWDRLAFLYDPLVPAGALRVERLVRYATWETTEVPRWEAEAIDRHVSLLAVPSRRNREDALAAGVRVPVVVLPHGVDPAVFSYVDRPAREPYTFGTFGELSPRKGVDVLLRAFRAAFRPDEPVRLLITGTRRDPGALLPAWAREDPRVVYRGGRVEDDELLALLGELDACVLPTRGEAFGLCGLEAMATGLPLIATGWGGPADYLDPADSLPLGYRLVEAGGAESNDVRYFGRWAEPDEGHLGELLRWCYEQRATAAAMGRAAAARIGAGWTWDLAAARLARLLDAVAAGVSPS
jgi:glycosyltransferase involved in cell wall biosynthesis